jgi:putative RNA 2'-phosphotransferase
MRIDREKLSKTMAHALRHAPEVYDLHLDAEGWVELEDLLRSLRARRRAWNDLESHHIEDLLAHADKKRFELRDGRIRALYAHSLPTRITKQPAPPPEVLFHGTTRQAAPAIERDGLRPMDRQYVHLSLDVATARTVGLRRDPEPVILRVRAGEAHREGVIFYPGHEEIWLSEPIPARYVERLEEAP